MWDWKFVTVRVKPVRENQRERRKIQSQAVSKRWWPCGGWVCWSRAKPVSVTEVKFTYKQDLSRHSAQWFGPLVLNGSKGKSCSGPHLPQNWRLWQQGSLLHDTGGAVATI